MNTGKLLIKVCGMKDVGNRRQLEELPVDLFGFIFHPPSPRHAGDLSRSGLQELADTLKMKAGVFVNESTVNILSASQIAGLTHIQLHGNETPGQCRELSEMGLIVIKAFRIGNDFDFNVTRDYEEYCGYFLFDTKAEVAGGSGRKFNWGLLDNYRGETPFFLSGGIGPGDAEVILKFSHPRLAGLDLNSGFEDVPGLKNPAKLKYFLEQILQNQAKI